MRTLKRFFNKFVIFVIVLNTQMDLFILKTDVETFTSKNKKTLNLIFKTNKAETNTMLLDFMQNHIDDNESSCSSNTSTEQHTN